MAEGLCFKGSWDGSLTWEQSLVSRSGLCEGAARGTRSPCWIVSLGHLCSGAMSRQDRARKSVVGGGWVPWWKRPAQMVSGLRSQAGPRRWPCGCRPQWGLTPFPSAPSFHSLCARSSRRPRRQALVSLQLCTRSCYVWPFVPTTFLSDTVQLPALCLLEQAPRIPVG